MPLSAESQCIGTVLVVDDSAVQRMHAGRLCRALGVVTVHEAANGREALSLLDALTPPPDLLIVDLEMPTMDGPELLEHLGRRGTTTPIIVASSRERVLLNTVLDMGSAVGLKVVCALQKPLQIDTLRAALHDVTASAGARQRQSRLLPVAAPDLLAGMERGEIVVHYQPKVDILTGDVRGLEALARWQHPTLGMVPPDQFIPLAEQHDLIHPLTMQVMSQAMAQTATWNMYGLDLTIAINLSPQLLNRSELLQEISGLQKCHTLPTDHVVLEVTETSLVRELGVALGVLTRLRLRGFGLSLDDYGTGFSSLQQLTRIPFTELKVDRSFVHGAHERESLRVILRSALELASKLGITSVAEGVETMEDWRLLQEYGCAVGQGWLIAKAMPADEFMPWFERHAARKGVFRFDGDTSVRANGGSQPL